VEPIYQMFPHTTSGFAELGKKIEPFHMILNGYRNHDHVQVKFNQLINHIKKPFIYIIEAFSRHDIYMVVDKHITKASIILNTTVAHIDSTIHQYKTLDIQYPMNHSFFGTVRSYLKQYSAHRHKSKMYLYRHFEPVENWKNIADTNSTVDMWSIADVYNIIATITSWTFHLNNEYNTTGCLGKGIPYIPEVTVLCKKLTFVAPKYTVFWVCFIY
jgi:hypothetical protein